MNNEHFDELMKITYFRAVTNRLRERGLITRDEFEKIVKSIEQMETDLVAERPKNQASPDKPIVVE